ncbi:MAG: antitoxin Xre/MbcA/ParS toxin-binding domain-containing protein [Xenococcus sp. (in: cyanobacteria)]
MTRSALPTVKPVLPIYKSGNLSLKQLAKFIDVNYSQLSKIAGVNSRTIERDLASTKTTKKMQPLIYALEMLWELTDGSQDKIQAWLKEPLVEWRGISPLDRLLVNDIDPVVQIVERIYYGDSAGY